MPVAVLSLFQTAVLMRYVRTAVMPITFIYAVLIVIFNLIADLLEL